MIRGFQLLQVISDLCSGNKLEFINKYELIHIKSCMNLFVVLSPRDSMILTNPENYFTEVFNGAVNKKFKL